MPPKCSIWYHLIFLLVLATTTQAEQICSILSSKEVQMGSSFNISCVFKKECKKLIFYQDEVEFKNYWEFNSSVVIKSIFNLTEKTTFTCKCAEDPEPCGTDITPGYPPTVPQNLTCVQEGEYGKVNCTWKTGRETYIKTTSLLCVHGNAVNYTGVEYHDGTCWATFPISSTQTHFSVWVSATNSLGSVHSPNVTFKLDDIVKPLRPSIKKVVCSSRQCQLQPDKPFNWWRSDILQTRDIQLVEIRYTADKRSWNTTFFNNTSSNKSWTVTSLTPYSMYTFQVRYKISPTRGLWSEWSNNETMTDEEVPVAMIDAWYIEESTQGGNKHFRLFWKEMSKSEARGKILKYKLTIVTQTKINSTLLEPVIKSHSVACSLCNVSISANNSKGYSPLRVLQLRSIAPLSFSVSHKYVDNHSIALSWPSNDGAGPVTEYLVEWYPTGRKHQFQWFRVKPDVNTTDITGLHLAECYEGAVIYLRSNRMQKAVFSGVSTWQSAPLQGPQCSTQVNSQSVLVKWDEIPPDRRGGCLIKYSIYLEDSQGKIQNYSVRHPCREYTIKDLNEVQSYKLWVSAWTAAGEGPKGKEQSFYTRGQIQPLGDKPLALVISVGGAVFLICLFLLCICQFPSVHRRLTLCCHCLMPSIVPDPANSKWAKECTSEKGEMTLHLYLSDSFISEEEPDTVEVQELSQEKLLKREIFSADGIHHSVSNLSLLEQEPCVPSTAYQPTITSSYLKSFSHESGSSDATQASRSTDITVDYISAHGVMSEEENEEDEDENMEMLNFFPCPQSPFLEPLISFGGKLTLDTVKIDCSDFLDCT